MNDIKKKTNAELLIELMDPSTPKTEREQAAVLEIAHLRYLIANDSKKIHDRITKDQNKEAILDYLEKKGFNFIQFNGGNHVRIFHDKHIIDLWPSTERWKDKNGSYSIGFRKLLRVLGDVYEGT